MHAAEAQLVVVWRIVGGIASIVLFFSSFSFFILLCVRVGGREGVMRARQRGRGRWRGCNNEYRISNR